MPAKLIVVSGAAPGTVFDIQDVVLRIGSGRQCEFCLRDAELAAHAATLEFRDDGSYLLHNRSNDPIEINGKHLAIRDSTKWSAGWEADLGHGLTLRLDVEGDPAPAKPAAPEYTIEYDADEPDNDKAATARKGGGMRLLQWAGILALIPLGIWMLMAKPAADGNNPADTAVSFSDVIGKLADSHRDKQRGALSLRDALQRAHAAEIRGDPKQARQQYNVIRDTLLLRRQPDGTFREPEDQLVWSYVGGRIQTLHGAGTP